MNILNQKVTELQELAYKNGINLMESRFVNHDNAHVLANNQAKKILVLVEKAEIVKAYSVNLENWLDAESKGINSDQIISGLSVLRAFGSRMGQRYISKGDIFQEILLEDADSHLEIIS